MTRLVLIALLAGAAGCAAPVGSEDSPREPLRLGPDDGAGRAGGASAGPAGGDSAAPAPEPTAREGAGGAQAVAEGAAADPAPSAGPQADPRPGDRPPAWWSEQPVRRGEEVSVCAEATAPELRAARSAAIRAAHARLEEELGGPAAEAWIGGDYEASPEGGAWRFRVRVTGLRAQ